MMPTLSRPRRASRRAERCRLRPGRSDALHSARRLGGGEPRAPVAASEPGTPGQCPRRQCLRRARRCTRPCPDPVRRARRQRRAPFIDGRRAANYHRALAANLGTTPGYECQVEKLCKAQVNPHHPKEYGIRSTDHVCRDRTRLINTYIIHDRRKDIIR